MKKFILAACLTAMMVIGFSISAQAQNSSDDGLVGRAIGAYRAQCDPNFNGQISGSVETLGICFVDGFITRVNLFPVIHCPGNTPCNYFPIRLGSVDFGCDGEIISVNCD